MDFNTIGSKVRRSSIFIGVRRTTVFQRFQAKAIDGIILIALFCLGRSLWEPLGGILAALVAASQDSWGVGQSIGKKIISIRVIEESTGAGCSIINSVLRNVPFWLSFLLGGIPLIGPFVLFFTGLAMIFECYFITTIDTGVRLGDVLGNTLVEEYLAEEREVL